MSRGKGSQAMVGSDTETVILNDTEIADEHVMAALRLQAPEIAALVNWGTRTQASGRNGGLFERDRYLTPPSIFMQFKTALDAAESDDVVSGVLETTESLAFNKISVECDDEDEQDVWNQILDDIDYYTRSREMWRELFTISQFYCATYWVRKDYKVRGKTTSGNKKKKEFKNILVPGGITLLDPLKIVPVGNFMFGQEQLAYIANRGDVQNFDQVLAGNNTTDLVVVQLLQGRYDPPREEKKHLQGITQTNVDNLYLMNPNNVWRHCATRPGYQKFASVRMKSVFELLDIKQQLRQMDRAHLVGATNFIILVKKGNDLMPARKGELDSLAGQVRSAARVPIIVGDHRLEIEIITPKVDFTLIPEKYNTLDARITSRLFQMFMTGNYSAGAKGDDSIKLARVVARGMETRRQMIARSTERFVLQPTFEANPQFTTVPCLHFHPKRIALDFDPAVLSFYEELRMLGDMSRDTILSEMDIDQEQEARRRKREALLYDDIFKPPMAMLAPGAEGGPPAPPLPPVAGVSGKAATPKTGPRGGASAGGKVAGRAGGRRGGTNKDSFKSQPGRGPSKAFETFVESEEVVAELEEDEE